MPPTINRALQSRGKKVQSVRVMRLIVIIFFGISSLFAAMNPALAGELPPGDFSELEKTGSARVENIIDPETVQLDNKTIIHLAGIEYPDFNSENPGEFSLVALKILHDMLAGKTVNIYQTKNEKTGRANRMGHQIAHLERQADNAWVQGALVMLGLAITRTAAANPEMAPQMLILEEIARAEKNGLWNKSQFSILTPNEAKNHIGKVRIVQGKIMSAAIKNNRIYLNFGPDWRSDFTVTVAPENKRAFSREKIDLLKLNGKTVRVRGWIDEYNGPVIDIDHPQALEVMQ